MWLKLADLTLSSTLDVRVISFVCFPQNLIVAAMEAGINLVIALEEGHATIL